MKKVELTAKRKQRRALLEAKRKKAFKALKHKWRIQLER